jgi:hypothetical protein
MRVQIRRKLGLDPVSAAVFSAFQWRTFHMAEKSAFRTSDLSWLGVANTLITLGQHKMVLESCRAATFGKNLYDAAVQ